MPESDRVQYNLSGLMNLTLNKNSVFKVENNQYIEAIQLSSNLTKMILYLKSGIHYDDNASEIDLFAKEIIFNLIIKTETEIICPKWYKEGVFQNGQFDLWEHIGLQESITVFRTYSAERICDLAVNSPTAVTKHTELYERIFGILQNNNPVVQFMSLYQILLEVANLLAGVKAEKDYIQGNVVNYMELHKDQYSFVKFKPSRDPRKKSKKNGEIKMEDTFTYIRNEIGHSEETNDLNAYRTAGSQIDTQLIKNLLIVLNDMLLQL